MKTESQTILSLAKENQEFTKKLRHRLHEIPELQWEEEKTLALIKDEILKIKARSKIPLELCEREGGIFVDTHIDSSSERLLFRADIDGLPIQEKTGLPFASTHPNKMHACGHDCHTAMLLGALHILGQNPFLLPHNIRFVFQRAEEIGPKPSGGKRLIEEGILEGISYCYALHISSIDKKGLFYSRPSHVLSQPTELKIEISTTGGHVMRPEFGSNAIDVMTDIHVSLRGLDLRELGPHEPICFVPSISAAGKASGIRPNSGEMTYAIRHFLSPNKLERFIAAIKRRVEAILSGYPKATLSTFAITPGYPVLKNDPERYLFVKEILENEGMKTGTILPLFAGEDFAYYLEKCKGAYWSLGAETDEPSDHHSPTFNPDESVLWQGVAFWLSLAKANHTS